MSLYTPYKAVGVVTDGSPFVVNHLGEETFISVSIGSLFQVYRTDKLTVCLVGRETPNAERITSLQVSGKETFCAVGPKILVYDRTRLVRTYEGHSTNVLGMCMVGRTLLSWDTGGCMRLIDTQKREVLSTLTSLERSTITAVAHPATYINKFVVGYDNGALELWNVHKQRLVYKFTAHLLALTAAAGRGRGGASVGGNGDEDTDFFSRNVFNEEKHSDPGVSCLEQSPAVDVFGVGFTDGTILLLNLKLDKVLFRFKQEGGAVTSLTFRTDAATQGFPYMASGSADGRIHVWNLGTQSSQSDDEGSDDEGGRRAKPPLRLERKLQFSLEEAHRSRVGRVHFLHGEPILISSAADNTIKMWIFDAPDGSARLLRSREGHSGHPTKIRSYGGDTAVSMRDNATAESCEVISAGSDGTLRLLNTAIESQNREMSQKPLLKKLGFQRRNARLPQIVDFDFSEARSRDWGNLVTVHQGHANAYVWRYKDRVATEMILRQPHWVGDERMGSGDRRHHSTAVCLTPCGNFGLVGSREGVIYRYNLQSGLPRGSYPRNRGKDSNIKKGTLQARAAMPGHVLHDWNKLIGGEKWVPLNPKNPSAGEPTSAAVAASTAPPAPQLPEGHKDEVKGIFIDITNSVMVSAGLDGYVIFWDLESGKVINAVQGTSPCLLLVGFRDASFVAVAFQDRVVRVYDLATCKLSRRFDGHRREVTDIAFTPDGRRLLTSSADCTVRVWDMPTGRCLSWISFGAPVMSMAMALSGESLCVAQAGKDGVYVYIDRSLYEPIQFWKEPTQPTRVLDCTVITASDASAGEAGDDAEELGGKGAAGNSDNDDTDGEGNNDDDDDDDDEGEEGREIKATQAQVVTEEARETAEQRGVGSLTKSSLPRGYWSSLFNLEAIKARNKPVAPPAPKKAAPFFLPTIFRGGSTSSFPTPQEYADLQRSLREKEADLGAGLAEGQSKALSASASASASATTASASKKRKSSGGGGAATAAVEEEEKSEDAVMAELAAMGSAWTDDDAAAGWGPAAAAAAGTGSGSGSGSAALAAAGKNKKASRLTSSAAADFFHSQSAGGGAFDDAAMEEVPADLLQSGSRYQSRLINRKTVLPRCKLVAYLLQEFPDSALGTSAAAEFFLTGTAEGRDRSGAAAAAEGAQRRSLTLEYLKTLTPPAVDLELRALCTHGKDEEGLQLLHGLLTFLTERFITGLDFEVMEAYLHRALLIFGEIIVAAPYLLSAAKRLGEVHAKSSEKLRNLVQGNLCLLKLLANLPPI